MPIDPKQLAAFSADPVMPPPGDPSGMDDMGEEPEVTSAHPSPEEQEKRLAHLVLVLTRVGDDLQGFVDEIDADLLDDMSAELPPEEAEAIEAAIGSLPSEVRAAVSAAGEMSEYDTKFVADELAGNEIVDDADRFAGWLMRASQVINGGLPHEESEEEEAEPDDDDAEMAPPDEDAEMPAFGE